MVVQSDAFPHTRASVVVCEMTSLIADAPDFRVTVEPSEANGLRKVSQVMADNRQRSGVRGLAFASAILSGRTCFGSTGLLHSV